VERGHLYDRISGEGYYRNANDGDATRRLLLDPAAPDGAGRVALCSIDPITQVDHSAIVVDMPLDGILVVDGVFAFRPQLDPSWDLRIWMEIDPELSVRRGTTRDAALHRNVDEAKALYRDRYSVGEQIYVAEVNPMARADIVIDNTDFAVPVLRRG
jgi:uridine kinase